MQLKDKDAFLASAKRTIDLEKSAVSSLEQCLDSGFAHACWHMMNTKGRIIVTGMGKSGHIAGKIAATLASTGSPSFFVHPAEACHGDMGMITSSDCVLALSNSGTTKELLTLLPLIKRIKIPLISITGNSTSELAKASDFSLLVNVASEACPLNLAPTSSTTAALVIGDAIAIAILEARGFTAEEFAFSHPGGALGRKLLLRVSDVMITGSEIPSVRPEACLTHALIEMSSKGLGMTTISNSKNELLGVFTDGDLRRMLNEDLDLKGIQLASVVSKSAYSIKAHALAAEALALMEERQISSLVVTDSNNCIEGVVTMLSLLKAGIT